MIAGGRGRIEVNSSTWKGNRPSVREGRLTMQLKERPLVGRTKSCEAQALDVLREISGKGSVRTISLTKDQACIYGIAAQNLELGKRKIARIAINSNGKGMSQAYCISINTSEENEISVISECIINHLLITYNCCRTFSKVISGIINGRCM